MFRLLNNVRHVRVSGSSQISVLQRRWKKPVDSAQVRLETRTRDLRLDKLTYQLNKLKVVLCLHELILKQRGHFISVQLLSKWRREFGINIGIGDFLRKYPHIFEIYTHPVKKNICCRISQKMIDRIAEVKKIALQCEFSAVERLKKLLMISTNGTLHLHSIWLIRKELGLPSDFRKSVLPKYSKDLIMVHPDTLQLVSKSEISLDAEVEKWREKECREKWLSEFETRYAFPIYLPTGFVIEKGFREKLKNWQRLPYLKPYEKKVVGLYGGGNRLEKRVVGVLHEFLSLTVEKMVRMERFSHFRRDFDLKVNLRELVLKHPGIFYISTKGETQTVFLREAYKKGCLINSNPLYSARRNVLELILLGCRATNISEEKVDSLADKAS